MAGVYDITIEQAATFDVTLTWEDASGSTIDLTGYAAAMDVRSADGTLITDVGVDGTFTLGGSAGTVRIVLPATVTDDLPAGSYVYDLFLTAPAGKVTRLLEGRAEVVARVTR
jgi:hypothetical protein